MDGNHNDHDGNVLISTTSGADNDKDDDNDGSRRQDDGSVDSRRHGENDIESAHFCTRSLAMKTCDECVRACEG